jgi:DNA-binding XRE family transcriptional regulator
MKQQVGLTQTDQRICKRFRQTRIKAKETQTQFAKKLGCNVPYVKAVEQEKFVPNFRIMRKWKTVYRKSYNWIIDGA